MAKTASDLVAEARARITEIGIVDVVSRMSRITLIDVREPAEYATGHITSAINIPRGVLEFEVAAHPALGNVTDPALGDRHAPIVLYCRSGGRAALSALALQAMGFDDVASIEGGIMAWESAGLPLTQHRD